MSTQTKKSRVPSGFLLVICGLVLGYMHGYRVITLEEVPSSHRPMEPFLSADYGAAHLSARD